MLLLCKESLYPRHIKRKRLVVSNAQSVEQQISVFLYKSFLKSRKSVLGDHVEMNVTKRYGPWTILYRYLPFNFNCLDLDGQYLLKTATAT